MVHPIFSITIFQILFASSSFLVEPLISWNGAQFTTECTINSSLTISLNCSSMQISTTLDIFHNFIASANVQVLNLSCNKLQTFPTALFIQHFPQLIVLDLSKNLIKRLNDDNTLVWPNLRQLNLSCNLLRQLRANDLNFALNLNSVSLSNNKLFNIENDAFQHAHQLQSLNLAHNQLSFPQSKWFAGLSQLLELRLDNNGIKYLSTGVFLHLRNLRQLNLSNNKLRLIEKKTFSGLELHLERLDLAFNNLIRLPREEALCTLSKLKFLNLNGAHFTRITAALGERFYGLTNLNVLKLNGLKQLIMIDRQAFVNLPNLRRLELKDGAALKYFSGNAFNSVPSLDILLLRNNPSLQIAPLAEWYTAAPHLRHVDLLNCSELLCHCKTTLAAVSAAHQFNGSSYTKGLLLFANATCQDNSGDVHLLLRASNRSICTKAPHVISVFPNRVQISEGQTLHLPCRVYPELDSTALNLKWHLPKHLSNFDTQSNFQVTTFGDLLLRNANSRLNGRYVCTVEHVDLEHVSVLNQAFVDVEVKELNVKIILTKASVSSITITWHKLGKLEQYAVYYKVLDTTSLLNDNYKILYLKSYMRTITINDLSSNTKYEVCIGLKVQFSKDKLHCLVAITPKFDSSTIEALSSGHVTVILISTIVVVMMLFILCLIFCSAHKHGKREAIDSWSQKSLATGSTVSDTTPMTFENCAIEDLVSSNIATTQISQLTVTMCYVHDNEEGEPQKLLEDHQLESTSCSTSVNLKMMKRTVQCNCLASVPTVSVVRTPHNSEAIVLVNDKPQFTANSCPSDNHNK